MFSGIGGLNLAAKAAGFKSVCQCEWNDYTHIEIELIEEIICCSNFIKMFSKPEKF